MCLALPKPVPSLLRVLRLVEALKQLWSNGRDVLIEGIKDGVM